MSCSILQASCSAAISSRPAFRQTDNYGINCVLSVYDLNQNPNTDVSTLQVNVFKTLRCNVISQKVDDNVDQATDA